MDQNPVNLNCDYMSLLNFYWHLWRTRICKSIKNRHSEFDRIGQTSTFEGKIEFFSITVTYHILLTCTPRPSLFAWSVHRWGMTGDADTSGTNEGFNRDSRMGVVWRDEDETCVEEDDQVVPLTMLSRLLAPGTMSQEHCVLSAPCHQTTVEEFS